MQVPVLNISISPQTQRCTPLVIYIQQRRNILSPVLLNFTGNETEAKDKVKYRSDPGKEMMIKLAFFLQLNAISCALFVQFKCCSFITQNYLPKIQGSYAITKSPKSCKDREEEEEGGRTEGRQQPALFPLPDSLYHNWTLFSFSPSLSLSSLSLVSITPTIKHLHIN